MDDRETMARDQIAVIWAETLGVEKVTDTDSFFELGGDSIMINIMFLRVEQDLMTVVTTDTIFDHPTLLEFTRAVLNGSDSLSLN